MKTIRTNVEEKARLWSKIFAVACVATTLGVHSTFAQGLGAAAVSLPAGVSVQDASAQQLASAVAAAVAKNPDQAPGIVAGIIGQLSASDAARAEAILSAVAALPAMQESGRLAAVVHAAAKANPALAVASAVGAATAAPAFAGEIARAAVAAVPDQRDGLVSGLAAIAGVDADAIASAAQLGMEDANQTDSAGRSEGRAPNPGSGTTNPANMTGAEVSKS